MKDEKGIAVLGLLAILTGCASEPPAKCDLPADYFDKAKPKVVPRGTKPALPNTINIWEKMQGG